MSRILVVIDPSAGEQPALERAAWLAETAHAPLELFTCTYDQDVAHDQRAVASVVQANRDRLDSLARPLEQRGLTVTRDADGTDRSMRASSAKSSSRNRRSW